MFCQTSNLLLRIFLSSNSSNVGLSDSLLMSLAPMMDLSNLRSSSEATWRIFRSINSCRFGRWANFIAKESLRASLAANRSKQSNKIRHFSSTSCIINRIIRIPSVNESKSSNIKSLRASLAASRSKQRHKIRHFQ